MNKSKLQRKGITTDGRENLRRYEILNYRRRSIRGGRVNINTSAPPKTITVPKKDIPKIKEKVKGVETKNAVKLKPTCTKGEGDALKRIFTTNGKKVEINSGHGYRESGHRTGSARDVGTMDEIESVILNDINSAIKYGIDFPSPPKTIERTILVNGKTVGYTVTKTSDGTARVSTYYPK